MNLSDHAALWISRGGEQWHKVLNAQKDRWHPTYFQYGTFVLPRGESDNETLLFNGQALNGLGGKAYVANIRQTSQGHEARARSDAPAGKHRTE